jgi:hypothetical protein
MESQLQYPVQALLIRETERMGIPHQRLVAELPTHRGGFILFDSDPLEPPCIAEDLHETDRLVFFFDSERLAQTAGRLVLVLQPNTASRWTAQGRFSFSGHPLLACGAAIASDDSRGKLRLEISPRSDLLYRWGYSRHAGMRQACQQAFDRPAVVEEATMLHVTYLSQQWRSIGSGIRDVEYGSVEVEISHREIEEVQRIDLCEQLLDALNDAFAQDDRFLVWSAKSFDEVEVARITKEFEQEQNRKGKERSFTAILGNRRERVLYGKRIQPTIEYPVTIVDQNPRECVTVGIACR